MLPDSGFIHDGGRIVEHVPDAEPGDAGPHVCNPACGADTVCACLDTRGAPSCGCHPRQGYAARCDPQAAESCKWPFTCVKSRTIEGTAHICSDGREGTPCSRTQDTCNTELGCTCVMTPFGTACSCTGLTGESPLLCDPLEPRTCPGGTCVRVDGQGGAFNICSDGSEHEPCEPGDGSCRTTLGCTCPYVGGRRVCRCSEPGSYAGYACDPTVRESCVAPLECAVRGDPIEGGFNSECAPDFRRADAGTSDPFACDPSAPRCPPNYECAEVRPEVWRCRPASL